MPIGTTGTTHKCQMIMINGVWITTQSKSITSSQNNDKMPSINMHISLKQYPGFDLKEICPRGK
jgi:hypothetical protein